MKWREFRMKKGTKFLIWKIRNLGESYETEHGMLGGAMQSFSDSPGDKGKPGTKAYVNSTDNTIFHISREIRKKEEHGYIEVDSDGNFVSEQVTSIFFDKVLPKSFTCYKPQTDIDPKALEKLHASKKTRYSRKYDGMAHVACHHVWGWEIYTRRMDLATEKFPNHVKELEAHPEFGVGTVLIGECVCSKTDGKDDFKAVSRFCRSLIDEARKLVEDKEIPEPELIIFDMLFHNGQDLKDKSYDERAKIWKHLSKRGGKSLVNSVDFFNVSPDSWEKTAKTNGWEGFVVTDGAAIPGEKFYSFDGDSKRPKGHHKLKPIMTEDVVVYAGALGSGKRLGKVGALFVKQLDPKNNQFFDCGKVGSGFTDDDIEMFTKLCKENNIPILEKDTEAKKIDLQKHCDIVIELEFGERQEDTNKFRFPVFIRQRFDKKPEECFANL